MINYFTQRGNKAKNRDPFFRVNNTQTSNDSPIYQILLDNPPLQSKKSPEGLAGLLPRLPSNTKN